MWHIVVLSHLLSEERFSTAGGTCDKDFHGLELALLGEFVLDELDVLGHTSFAVPVELEDIPTFSLFLTASSSLLFDEKRTRSYIKI